MTTKETFLKEREKEFDAKFPELLSRDSGDETGFVRAFHRETISLLAGKLIEALEGEMDDGINPHTGMPDYTQFNKGWSAGYNSGICRAKELVKERFNLEKE